MSEELKPCPFCGGEAKEDNFIGGVVCENLCTNPNTFDGGGGVWTADWNTRPIEDALTARIAELEADNAEFRQLIRDWSIVLDQDDEFQLWQVESVRQAMLEINKEREE